MRTLRAAFLVALLAPAALSAQQAIRGHVVDDQNLRPVPEAQVTLLSEDERLRAVTTDSEGFFVLPLPGPGSYRLEARRFGYRTATSQPVRVMSRDTVTVEFRVDPDVILLDPIVITDRIRGRSHFQRREEEWGRGIFLGPEDVDSIVDRHIGEVFENQEEIILFWDKGPWGVIPRPVPYGGRSCLHYMVDWFPVRGVSNPWSDYPLNTLRPSDIRAVEIYRTPAEAPRELRNEVIDIGSSRACGLVVFWTRAAW